MSGFYLMHRGWMDNPAFKKERFTDCMAWEWLIHEASFEPHEVRINYEMIVVNRGQVPTSYRKLKEVWGWGNGRIIKTLLLWKSRGMIELNQERGLTVVTICNYDKYQKPNKEAGTQLETGVGTVVETQVGTNINKGNKIKEIKRNISVDFKKEFEEFWKAYPKKVAKQEALKIYSRIISSGKATPEDLLNGLKAYLQTEDVKRGYPCNPSTWLNQARWQDEHEKSPEQNQALPDSQRAKNLMYLRDTLQKPLDVQQSSWLKTYKNQQGGLANG